MKQLSERTQIRKRSNHTSMDFTTAYKSVISSLFLFWGSRSTASCPMQTPKHNPTTTTTHQNLKSGLKTLISNVHPRSISHDHRHIVHKNYKLAMAPPSQCSSPMVDNNSSSWTSSTMTDDLLGTDSGVAFMATSHDDMFMSAKTTATTITTRRSAKIRKHSERVKREFPPPIPLLAQTGNLQCRMPWNLTRRYYPDGRLVLRGEKAQHHEYFEAERGDGRLVLKLVPLDETVLITSSVEGHLEVFEEEEEEEELEMENVEFAEDDDDYAEDDDDDDDDDECVINNVDDDEGKLSMLVCNSVPDSNSEMSRRAERYGNNMPIYFTKSVHKNYFAHPAASAPLLPMAAVS